MEQKILELNVSISEMRSEIDADNAAGVSRRLEDLSKSLHDLIKLANELVKPNEGIYVCY